MGFIPFLEILNNKSLSPSIIDKKTLVNNSSKSLNKLKMSDLPAPNFDGCEMNRYLMLSLSSSRGCPFECSFCAEIGDLLTTRKSVIFSLILVFLGFLVIELLTRGAFRLYGRYDTWGYQTKNVEFRPYIGFASSPYDGGTDRYGFKLDSNDNPERNLEKKEDCEFRIFLLGGSTVAGRFPHNSEDTLSFRIEQLLNEQSRKIFKDDIQFN